MSMKMKLKIIIPVNTTEFTEQISKSVNRFRSDKVTIDLEHIDHGTPFIQSRVDLTINAPYVLDKVIQAEQDGYQGVFVTDMDMCGVEAARQAVKIPVVGGFRPNFFTAMLLSQKVSILTVRDVVDLQNEHVRAFGVTENLASILPLDKCVNELKAPSPDAEEIILTELFELACRAIEQDGAGSIMFGCTGFTSFSAPLSELLTAKYKQNVPVIDPNCCAMGYLIMLVENGLSQSGLSYPYQSKIAYS
ncbi:Hydantoin racemase [Vibrio spartinae]|uniref:Hydantoin racemase n=2 Tax=Vibrio spartinae TaxID=1918945 RepID=A0ABX6QY44_9VIBR|nr:Hydantoin racemase [Vibrio spartinae]